MNKEEFIEQLKQNGIFADKSKVDEMFAFMEKTLEINEFFNLTALKYREDFIEKMLFDSALANLGIDYKDKEIIDVGTGAGYPGLVLYILDPNMRMTLLDSSNKKINYLKEYIASKGYSVNCVCDRAEEYAKSHRDTYDYAYARAVAALNILLEIIIPMVKVEGYFVALKGKDYQREIDESKNAFIKLNCHVEKVERFTLPESKEERYILLIKKDKETNNKYPRMYSQIKKNPL